MPTNTAVLQRGYISIVGMPNLCTEIFIDIQINYPHIMAIMELRNEEYKTTNCECSPENGNTIWLTSEVIPSTGEIYIPTSQICDIDSQWNYMYDDDLIAVDKEGPQFDLRENYALLTIITDYVNVQPTFDMPKININGSYLKLTTDEPNINELFLILLKRNDAKKYSSSKKINTAEEIIFYQNASWWKNNANDRLGDRPSNLCTAYTLDEITTDMAEEDRIILINQYVISHDGQLSSEYGINTTLRAS
jgi:hypothetical protein